MIQRTFVVDWVCRRLVVVVLEPENSFEVLVASDAAIELSPRAKRMQAGAMFIRFKTGIA